MTFQIREVLLYQGRLRPIQCLPLADYPGPRPRFSVMSSACWRGYAGTWEVRHDQLYLVAINPPHAPGAEQNFLEQMFPGCAGAVAAVWFNGELTPDDLGRTFRGIAEEDPEERPPFALVVHQGRVILEESVDRTGHAVSRLTAAARSLVEEGEWGFIEALHANLADVTPRLVYADWLEDRADPRASLVRARALQVQLEGRPPRQDLPGGPNLPARSSAPNTQDWFWRRLADVGENLGTA